MGPRDTADCLSFASPRRRCTWRDIGLPALAMLVVLVGAFPVRAAHSVTAWSLSTSPLDPLTTDNEGSPDVLYLWLACSSGAKVGYAHLQLDGTLQPLEFMPAGGVAILSAPNDLQLAFADCPRGPTLLGSIRVARPTEGNGTLVLRCAESDAAAIVDCSGGPLEGPHEMMSYSDVPESRFYNLPCATTSVSATSWARTKDCYRGVRSLYR